jgi:hypothetical protein
MRPLFRNFTIFANPANTLERNVSFTSDLRRDTQAAPSPIAALASRSASGIDRNA